MHVLAEALSTSSLISFNFSRVRSWSQSATELISSLPATLKHLNLDSNHLNDAAIRALAKIMCSFDSLDMRLYGDTPTPKTNVYIAAALADPTCQLTRLWTGFDYLSRSMRKAMTQNKSLLSFRGTYLSRRQARFADIICHRNAKLQNKS